MPAIEIRRATPDDAPGITAVLETIAAERIYSAISTAWTPDQERRYLESLSAREAFHVATADGRIIGFQSLDLWSALLPSMAHVGQVGTFLLPEWRSKGVGHELWKATERFARQAGFRKLVIQVRASNHAAQAFYASLGFGQCGRLTGQVVIDGVEDDEILMELMLRNPCV